MTETILTGEKVEKFALKNCFAILASFHAVFTRLFKDFLMGDRPCDAGYWKGQHEKHAKLSGKRGSHTKNCWL